MRFFGHVLYIFLLLDIICTAPKKPNRSLTEDTCCRGDSHRDLQHGGDRPADQGCRNRSVQTGNRLSYTCDTGAHRQVKVQKPPALRTAPPGDKEKKRTDDAICKHIVKIQSLATQ